MTDLLALAAECEKAEGPSRGLDRKIFEATTGLSASHWLPGFTGGSLIRHMDTPRYSDSIDAALTLVPAGMEYSISTLYGVADIEVGLNCSSEDGPWHSRRLDANVPLALVAAALRARAAGHGEG